MKNNYLITVILVVVFAAAGFYGGTIYQRNQASVNIGANGFGGGVGGRFSGGTGGAGRRAGGGQTVGIVLTQDASSMTVKLADDSSKIVLFTSSTIFDKSAPATVADLKVGDRVAVFGATNSDGSVSAVNVQLNPTQRMGRGPSGATGINQ